MAAVVAMSVITLARSSSQISLTCARNPLPTGGVSSSGVTRRQAVGEDQRGGWGRQTTRLLGAPLNPALRVVPVVPQEDLPQCLDLRLHPQGGLVAVQVVERS